MTLEAQIGQMLLAGFEGLEPPDYFLDWIRTGQIGGAILFGRNVETPQQLARLTQTLHAAAREAGQPPLLIGIDLVRAVTLLLEYLHVVCGVRVLMMLLLFLLLQYS